MMPPPPAPPVVPEPESSFAPALAAGVRTSRIFRRAFPGMKFPYRTALYVDNTRGAAVLALHAATGHGILTRRVGIGGTLDFSNVGPIYGYDLESAADVAADTFAVYENGGLNVPE